MAVRVVPESLGWIGGRVEARIDALLQSELDRWAALDVDLREPFQALQGLIRAGGKRLRPAFCHWAFVAAGGDPDAQLVVDAGAALELLHTFALIHDDVMDGSRRRRGKDTVHLTFESRHAEGSWRGEGRRFGEGVAILVGDLAFVYADVLLAGAPSDAADVFAQLRIEVNVGQYLDLLGTVRGDVGLDQARRISRYKSGKYTVERPLHLGAALAGRLDQLAEPLSAFGSPLGDAFQLRDELLGAFGDPAVTGKPVGQDLREGKPTTLLAFAVAAADSASAKLLADRFGAPDLTPEEVAELQAILEHTGAREQVEASIQNLLAEALAALERVPLVDGSLGRHARQQLAELACFAAGRDH